MHSTLQKIRYPSQKFEVLCNQTRIFETLEHNCILSEKFPTGENSDKNSLKQTGRGNFPTLSLPDAHTQLQAQAHTKRKGKKRKQNDNSMITMCFICDGVDKV